jgi:phage-related protein
MQVDQELCNCYNQLTNVLSNISFLQLQNLSVKIEAAASAAAAAYGADVANFQQNLISLTGGVEQLRESMEQQGQQFQQELGLVLPQLEKMGVQIQLLSLFESKFDRMFDMMSSVAGYMQQLQQQQQQQQQGQQEQQPTAGKEEGSPQT